MDIVEEWRDVLEFEGYEISDLGRIRSPLGRLLKPYYNANRNGHACVALTRKGVVTHRGLSLLVAKAFLPEAPNPAYNTVVNLDLDLTNNRADNLAWRPLWFCYKYKRQFKIYRRDSRAILDLETGEKFDCILDVAERYGLLVRDIDIALENHTPVWPTRQMFSYVVTTNK